jgi:uncharacterized protein (TIGR03083 family)
MTLAMTKDELFAAITVQRRQLSDTLDGLTEEQWNAPSLCAGWRVRDVVGHLLSILEIPMSRFILNVIKARSFDAYADRIAREIGARDPKALTTAYRATSDRRFAPPLVGPIAPLADVLIHTRDIERPLGLPSRLDPAALRNVLDYVCGGKARGFVPPSRTNDLRFDAPDLGWSVGTGPSVTGPGDAIMMAVTGRRSALADLSGDGVAILTARIG